MSKLTNLAAAGLVVSFFVYSLGLFSNYWASRAESVDPPVLSSRFGFFQTCSKGAGCNKITDKEALALLTIAFAFLVKTFGFSIYILTQKSNLDDDRISANRLRLLVLIQGLGLLFQIAGWATFAESKKDLASKFTEAGWSNYLVLVSFVINLITFIVVIVLNIVKKFKLYLLFAAIAFSGLTLLLFSTGLFSDKWIVGTALLPYKLNSGFFVACQNGKCIEDTFAICLSLELIGFVFLFSASLLSVFLTLYGTTFASEEKDKLVKWVVCFVFNVVAVALTVSGWSNFASKMPKNVAFASFTFDWSFYTVLISFLLATFSAVIIASSEIRNRLKINTSKM